MTNENIDISNELALMSKLEDFLFSQIRTSFTSQVRFEPSILQAQSNQELKKAIFELHDDGKFKETDENRKQRMGTAFFDTGFRDETGNLQAEKSLNQYLPKHHDEIITHLRTFYSLVDQKKYDSAKIQSKTTISAYAKHYDCNDLNWVPESLRPVIQPIRARNFRTIKFLRVYKVICYMHVEEMLTKENPKTFKSKDDLYKEIDCGESGLTQKIINSIKEELRKLQFQIIVKRDGKEVSRMLFEEFEKITGSYIINNEELFSIDFARKIKVKDGVKLMATGLQYQIAHEHNFIKKNEIRKAKDLDSFFENRYDADLPLSIKNDFTRLPEILKKQFDSYDDQMSACKEAIDHLTEELIAYESDKQPQSRKWLNELPQLKKKLEQKYIEKK
ncbi:hypothetical protein [Acinetobacter venetianus]|uniref:Uncharacterized protein n=1 Tax=Acinetobacter venetianus TaxID=52133 RepID=A0A150HTU5_9GAMM|nr:hypothetical protein [Acinetobacter venetianus]KXZ70250.1 hypothetical protein AVENLUH13518_01929 [Acinetobacter venetianus]